MSSLEGLVCRSRPWQVVAGRLVLPRVASDVAWSGTVLEVGGGSGAMADQLLRTHAHIERVIVADVDPSMVRVAKRRLVAHGDRAEVIQIDGHTLPFERGAIDIACAWLMLHHVIDWERLLTEVGRVLRPGGQFVGYDLTDAPLGRVLHGVSRSDHRLVGPAQLRSALVDSDFREVRVETYALGQTMTFSGAGGVGPRA